MTQSFKGGKGGQGALNVYGQYFYQQDFWVRSILEIEFMYKSAASGTVYTWSQFSHFMTLL